MGEILGRVVVGRRVRRDEHDDRIKDIETMSVAPDYAGRTAMRAGRDRSRSSAPFNGVSSHGVDSIIK
jgi:hypothetical protein